MESDIRARLSTLERSVRRWRLATLALIAVAVAGGITSFAGGPKDLTVRSLKVVSPKGKRVASIDGVSWGGLLYLYDGADSVRVMLGVVPSDDARLILYPQRGRAPIIIPEGR